MIAQCLDDATIDDYVHARLPPDVRAVAESHVDSCPDCSAIVSVLAGGAPGRDKARAPEEGDEQELAKGTLVGRHVIVEPRGEGAMGIVYLAFDPELDRRVALKLLRPGSAPGAGERMQREAQAMAKVAHPNVVTVHDVGRFRGAIYLAMEFVDGPTLRVWCMQTRTPEERLDALVAAGRGLCAAHGAGLVHRDFKPENVLVGADGRVRVTDFGLARVDSAALSGEELELAASAASAAPEATLTRTGALLGTPAYMAPELWRGEEATPRSDQFAFAVTVFESLAGVRPFAGRTTAELRAAIARGPVFPADMPARVRSVLARALSVQPEDRYPSVEALLAELRPAAASPKRGLLWRAAPVALAVVVAGTSALFWRRQPAADPCSAGTGLSAAVMDPARADRIRAAFKANGSAWAAVAADRAIAAMDAYRTQWATAHRATCEATEVRHEQSAALLDARMHCLHRGLSQATSLAARFEHPDADTILNASEAASSLPSLAMCADTASLGAMEARPTGDRGAALTALETRLGAAHAAAVAGVSSAQQIAEARDMADAASALGYRPVIAEARLLLATLLRRSGAFALAMPEADAALVAAEGAHDDREAAFVWLELLALRGEAGRFADAIAAEAPATAAIARLGTPADLTASLRFELGVARTNLGEAEYAHARRDLEAALSARQQLFGEKHLDVARTLTALGNLTRLTNDLPAALALHQRALAIDTEVLGPGHPALARDHHNIGGVLRMQGDLPAAQAEYERALALETLGLGPRSLSVGRTENSLGLVAMARNELAPARAHFERAKDILAGHPDQALPLANLQLLATAERNSMQHAPTASAARTTAKPRPSSSATAATAATSATAPAPAQGSYGPAQTFDTERK